MAEVEIPMPKLSDSMEQATVVSWLKRTGDRVRRGEPLVEVETDKATIVYEAEQDGVLGDILVEEGGTADLGAAIARLVVDGDAAPRSPWPLLPHEAPAHVRAQLRLHATSPVGWASRSPRSRVRAGGRIVRADVGVPQGRSARRCSTADGERNGSR